MKIKMMIAVLATTMAYTSCKKDPIKGDTGAKGEIGATGNANVMSMTLTANSWNWDATNKLSYVTFNGLSQLSTTVVNGGAVMVYEGSTGDWMGMPYTIGISNIMLSTLFEYQTNTITIVKMVSDGTNPNPLVKQYKLVCIPPAIVKLHPNIDLNNYNEVKQTLNLKD